MERSPVDASTLEWLSNGEPFESVVTWTATWRELQLEQHWTEGGCHLLVQASDDTPYLIAFDFSDLAIAELVTAIGAQTPVWQGDEMVVEWLDGFLRFYDYNGLQVILPHELLEGLTSERPELLVIPTLPSDDEEDLQPETPTQLSLVAQDLLDAEDEHELLGAARTWQPSLETLHAYVEGRLAPPTLVQRFEALLQHRPDLQGELDEMRNPDAVLRAALMRGMELGRAVANAQSSTEAEADTFLGWDVDPVQLTVDVTLCCPTCLGGIEQQCSVPWSTYYSEGPARLLSMLEGWTWNEGAPLCPDHSGLAEHWCPVHGCTNLFSEPTQPLCTPCARLADPQLLLQLLYLTNRLVIFKMDHEADITAARAALIASVKRGGPDGR